MALQKPLRHALVALSLFSAAIAGQAQTTQQNVEALLTAPVQIQPQEQNKSLSTLSKTLVSNPTDSTSLSTLAQTLKTAPELMARSMQKAVTLLKLHLAPQDQATALQSMLAASSGQDGHAQTLLKKLPADNVVGESIEHVLELKNVLGTPTTWTDFTLAFLKLPQHNVQHTLSSPGVKSLQPILDSANVMPKTSVSVLDANVDYASKASEASKTLTLAFMDMRLTDGLIVGEYEGIPVVVMHDAKGANGSAALYKLNEKDGRDSTPYIALSLDMLNVLKDHPDAMAFILEHEAGHLHRHHTADNSTVQHELDADTSAIEHLHEKGMSAQRIAKAYSAFEHHFVGIQPEETLRKPGFVDMMALRHANAVRAIEHLAAPSSISNTASFAF